MKFVIKLAVSAFLLAGITACSQESATKVSKTVSAKTDKASTEGTICNTPTSSINGANQNPVIITETVAGDTIKVIYNGKEETVHYLLIDTPEDQNTGHCEQPYAIDAANRNKQLLHSGKVTLEFDEYLSKTDKYGNLQAYVFVNGTSVQETLLKEGFARLANYNDARYKYLIPYIRAQTEAKSKKLKIWSKSGYVTDKGFSGCK